MRESVNKRAPWSSVIVLCDVAGEKVPRNFKFGGRVTSLVTDIPHNITRECIDERNKQRNLLSLYLLVELATSWNPLSNFLTSFWDGTNYHEEPMECDDGLVDLLQTPALWTDRLRPAQQRK